jgi:NADH:ubiquinone oxidoreductase subunit 4 (subunit M)
MMAFINKENSTGIKTWATLVAGLDFVISIPLWFLYKPGGVEFQFATQFDWIPSVGVQYIFGVDGFSVLLILLTTLLGFIAVYSSFTAITERKKEYYISLLLCSGSSVRLTSSSFTSFGRSCSSPCTSLSASGVDPDGSMPRSSSSSTPWSVRC